MHFSFFFFKSRGSLTLKPSFPCAIFKPVIHTLHIGEPLLLPGRYVTAVALSPTMPWIATGSMDRSVNVWRIGDEITGTGKYLTKSCLVWRSQMHNHSSFRNQTTSSGFKPRSHLEPPRRVFWERSSRRRSHYMCIAVWLQSLEEEL